MDYEDVYNEKLELATNAIITECKKRITDNWNSKFDVWLYCDADSEFPSVYKKYMKEHFSNYITIHVENQIGFAATNLLFVLNTFMKYNNDPHLNNVIDFTDSFLEEQFENFDTWCEEIRTAMYEESPEYARDCAGN